MNKIIIAFCLISLTSFETAYSQNKHAKNIYFKYVMEAPFAKAADTAYVYLKQKYLTAIYNDYFIYGIGIVKVLDDGISTRIDHYDIYIFNIKQHLKGRFFDHDTLYKDTMSFNKFLKDVFVTNTFPVLNALELIKETINRNTGICKSIYKVKKDKEVLDSTNFFTLYTKKLANAALINKLLNAEGELFKDRVYYGSEEKGKAPNTNNSLNNQYYRTSQIISEINASQFFKVLDKKFIDKCIADFDKPI